MSVGDPGRPTGSRVADGAGSAAVGLLRRTLTVYPRGFSTTRTRGPARS